ncbi:MAG: PrsW family glutamic-type intramembrane protease [Patescibacteria group bacterium]
MFELISAASAAVSASAIGFVPVLIWLAFWLFQDWVHPEPNRRLLSAFIAGIFCVIAVLPLQQYFSVRFEFGTVLIFIWAGIEEIMKLLFAWVVVLRTRALDEPIDFPVYLITVALGFAALENSLFLFSSSLAGNVLDSAITGDLRFIGATLIHVLSSAVIGGALAIAYYRSKMRMLVYGVVGVILATVLHAGFNLLILATGAEAILTVFLGIWVGVVFMLLAFERIKLIRPPLWWERMFTPKRN